MMKVVSHQGHDGVEAERSESAVDTGVRVTKRSDVGSRLQRHCDAYQKQR